MSKNKQIYKVKRRIYSFWSKFPPSYPNKKLLGVVFPHVTMLY